MRDGGHGGAKPGFFASPPNIVLVAFPATGGFYLITEDNAHVISFLPWLLLNHAKERSFPCHRRTPAVAGAAPGAAGPDPVPTLGIWSGRGRIVLGG